MTQDATEIFARLSRLGEDGADLDESVRDTLLRTKLYRPQLTADHLVRERLIRKLDQVRHKPVTLIAAPAGYGKTTIVSEWVERSSLPASWISLDRDDNELTVFAEYLIAGLRTIFPDFGSELLSYSRVTRLPPLPFVTTKIANAIDELERDFVLVLDDFHHINDPEILKFLDSLLAHPPRGLHLVILTRHDPPLNLSKLRAQGLLLELRASDLRFSSEESVELLRGLGGGGSWSADLDLLSESAEGWAVGLRLAALAFAQMDGTIDRPLLLDDGNRFVVQYLFDEVLSQQSRPVRQFLLCSSILERFSKPLCAAVLGDMYAEEAIAPILETRSLFIEWLDFTGNWFRYHDFFRQFLQQQLQAQASASQIIDLHHRAATWFAANGDVEQAIFHYLRANDPKAAACALGTIIHKLINGERWLLIEALLAKFPGAALHGEPTLIATQSWVNLARFQLDKVKVGLDHLNQLLAVNTSMSGGEEQFVRSTLNCHSAILLHWAHDFDAAIACARQTLIIAGEDWSLEREYAWLHLAVATHHRDGAQAAQAILQEMYHGTDSRDRIGMVRSRIVAGFCYIDAADISSLKQMALQSIDHLGADRAVSNLAWFLTMAGTAHYLQNQLDSAESCFAEIWEQRMIAHPHAAIEAAAGLARTLIGQGRNDAAREVMDQMNRYCRDMELARSFPMVTAFCADVAWQLGDRRLGQQLIAQGDLPKEMNIMPLPFEAAFVRPKLLILQDTATSRASAAQILDELLIKLRDLHNAHGLIEVSALRAGLYAAEGDDAHATELLAQAIRLAEPGGIIRPFIDLGPMLRGTLERMAADGLESWCCEQILAALPHTTKTHSNGLRANDLLVEPLTDRELEVIFLLEQRLSNKEIADILVISPSTAKRHTINIYQKLGVNSRREAVTKAATLGLITQA